MDKNSILKKLKEKNIIITRDQSELDFLGTIEKIKSIDTKFVGNIDLFNLEGVLLVKEKDDKGNHYLRMVSTQEDYDEFAKDRLSVYDRMWDGCGCKVSYSDPWKPSTKN